MEDVYIIIKTIGAAGALLALIATPIWAVARIRAGLDDLRSSNDRLRACVEGVGEKLDKHILSTETRLALLERDVHDVKARIN